MTEDERGSYDVTEGRKILSLDNMICIPLFIIFNIGIIYLVTYFSGKGGSYNKLQQGQNESSEGTFICGDGPFKNYPQVYQTQQGVTQDDSTSKFSFDTSAIDLTKRVCVKMCPLFLSSDPDVFNMEFIDNGVEEKHFFVFDISQNSRWNQAKDQLESYLSAGNNISSLLQKFQDTPSHVPIFGSNINIGNYCMIEIDNTIPEVAEIQEQLTTLITSLGDQAVKKMMGTGNLAQFTSSIIQSIDMIFLSFIGSAMFGFIVLTLFAWKPFIVIMTYTMVFLIMIVLLVAGTIVNQMQMDSLESMQQMAPTVCFPSLPDHNTFVFFETFADLEQWKLWWWWPDQGSCTESFTMVQVLCISRWVLIVGSVIQCVFVLANFKAIEDAIDCIKLASEVLFQNFMLVLQPLQNVVFKVLFIVVFSLVIIQAMSTAGFTADTFSFVVPGVSGAGADFEIEIGGMSRKLDILHDPGKVGNDVQQMWLEIFTMQWWVALVLAVEEFSTIMTVVLWFFLQKDGKWVEGKTQGGVFCTALGQTFKQNFGTVLTGSFMVAVVWTAITACNVQKSAVEALLGHEKVHKVKEQIIQCVNWLLKKLKDCVNFGNSLAQIKVSLEKWGCFCCAQCEGLMEFLAKLGKAMMIMMINQFFSALGYILIMTGGAATFQTMLNSLEWSPIFGFPTKAIALPQVPIALSGLLSYFMAMLFMQVYDIAILTFMFVRDKNNELVCNNAFGPDSKDFKEIDDNIAKQDLTGVLTKEQKKELRQRIKERISNQIALSEQQGQAKIFEEDNSLGGV